MLDRGTRRIKLLLGAPSAVIVAVLAHVQIANGQALSLAPGEIEQITVTARLREEKLSETPIAVTALTAKDIDQLRIEDLTGTFGIVPNFYFDQTGRPGRDRLMLRGLGVNSPGYNAVAVFVDGVYMPRNSYRLSLYDTARIEVLRGPQGALFGRNTEAGAVSIITNEPQPAFTAAARIDYGSFTTQQFDAYVTGPVTKDFLFYLSGEENSTDGYIQNIHNGTPLLRGTGETLRAAFKIPGPVVEVVARADWSEQRGGFQGEKGRATDSADPDNITGRYQVAYDFDNYSIQDNYGASLTARSESNFALFEAIIGWRNQWSLGQFDADSEVSRDYGGGPTPNVLSRPDFPVPSGFGEIAATEIHERILSGELRASSMGDQRFRWIVGAIVFRESHGNEFNRRVPNPPPPRLCGFPGCTNHIIYNVDIVGNGHSEFAQAAYDLIPDVEVSAATRYDDYGEEKHGAADILIVSPQLLRTNRSVSFGALSPQGSIKYQWSPEFMTYVSVGEGYNSGGFDRGMSADPRGDVPFRSEFATNYEVGAKTTLLDNRLAANVALFYIPVRDAQVSQTRLVDGAAILATGNAASVRSQGVEIETTAQPVSWLDLRGSVGFTDAKYVSYVVNANSAPGSDLSGDRLPNIPEWTYSLGAIVTQSLDSGLAVQYTAEYRYIGSIIRGAGTVANPRNLSPAYGLLDAEVTVVSPHWNLALYVSNVLNAYAIYDRQSGFAIGFQDLSLATKFERIAAPPRTFGIRLSHNFH